MVCWKMAYPFLATLFASSLFNFLSLGRRVLAGGPVGRPLPLVLPRPHRLGSCAGWAWTPTSLFAFPLFPFLSLLRLLALDFHTERFSGPRN